MRNSTIIYQFKMEYESKINIFGLKMMVKSGQEKNIFWNSSMFKAFLENIFYFTEGKVFTFICKFSDKNDLLCAMRDFNKKVVMYVHIITATQARLWACGFGDVSTLSFGSHLNPILTRGGGANYAHRILVSTPSFESHRRACQL